MQRSLNAGHMWSVPGTNWSFLAQPSVAIIVAGCIYLLYLACKLAMLIKDRRSFRNRLQARLQDRVSQDPNHALVLRYSHEEDRTRAAALWVQVGRAFEMAPERMRLEDQLAAYVVDDPAWLPLESRFEDVLAVNCQAAGIHRSQLPALATLGELLDFFTLGIRAGTE